MKTRGVFWPCPHCGRNHIVEIGLNGQLSLPTMITCACGSISTIQIEINEDGEPVIGGSHLSADEIRPLTEMIFYQKDEKWRLN